MLIVMGSTGNRTLHSKTETSFSSLHDDCETPSERKRLAEHIKNRMDATDRYEGKRQRLAVILQSQARHIATFVRRERERYDPFIASW